MKKFIKIFLLSLFLTAVCLAAAVPAVNMALSNKNVRNDLLQRIASALKGEVKANALAITLDSKGINISCNNLKGVLLDSSLQFDVQRLVVKTGYAELLRGSLLPNTLQASSPRISYDKQPELYQTKPSKKNWQLKGNSLLKEIVGRKTRIDISDGSLTVGETSLSNFFMRTIPGSPASALTLSTEIECGGSVIPLELTGTTTTAFPYSFSYIFELKAGSVPLSVIPSMQDFYFSAGTADVSGILAGSRKGIKLDGKAVVSGLDMTVGWTSEDMIIHQEKKYRIEKCVLGVKGRLQGRKIDLQALTLKSDDFMLQGSLILDFVNILNPFMDLRLKSDEMELATLKMLLPDPLINDWTTRTIFPRLENGRARMTDFILAGTMDEIGKPGTDYLSWSGILHDVDSFYNDHIPLARVDSAKLSMKGDVLNITEVKGTSGPSTLSAGNLLIQGLYDHKSILKTDAEGSFSLSWLSDLAGAGIFGESLQQAVAPVSSVSGMLNGHINMNMSFGDELTLVNLESKGTAASMNLDLNTAVFPIRMEKTDFTLNYPGTCIIKGRGFWGRSTFNGTLNLVDFDKKQQFKLDVRPDIVELKKKITDNLTIRSLAPCIATLPMKADITLENGTISGLGNMDFSKSESVDNNICKQLIRENKLLQTDYSFNFNGKNLRINKINLHTRDGNMLMTGFVKNRKIFPFDFEKASLQASDFPVHSLILLMPADNIFLNGTLNAKLTAENLSVDNIWQTINGQLQLKGWSGAIADSPLTVNNLDLTAKMDNGRIKLQGTNMLQAGLYSYSPITFHAELNKEEVWDGTVRLYGESIDIKNNDSMIDDEHTQIYQYLPIGVIRIIAGFDQIRFRNLLFSPLLVESYLTADTIFTSNLLVQLDEDFFWLTGDRENQDFIYTSYFKVQNKPVDTYMALLGFDNEVITGELDMEGKLTARMTPGKNIFETVTGPVSFEIKNGTLKSSSTIIKILDLISLENIFDKQDILEWKNRFNYREISGIFEIGGGVCTTDSLIMDADAFDLFSEGNVDLLEKTVKMEVKLAPFGTINKLFSSIPFLGYVLTGKTKSIFDYSLSVVGKIGNPEVTYKPFIDTITSITGYAKRLISGKEEIQKVINTHLLTDMARKKSFIRRVNDELSPLHPAQ